jgi:predicted nucleic acid-binding protein
MTFPQFIKEINKHLVIRSLRSRAKIHSKLLKMNFSEAVLNNINYISVPYFKFDAYKEHYEFIGKDNPYHPIPFALDDFALAYIAAENGFGLVSYDHHLLSQITAYLDYDCYWPQDINILPADSMVLLDTNIFVHLIEEKKSQQKNEIEAMFEENKSITFLLTDHIFKELCSVYKKKFQKEESEDELNKFIDDFIGFESNHKQRILMKKKQKKKNLIKTVNVCRRYRKLYRSLNS